MSASFPASGERLREQFESASVDPAAFGHRAHLRIAWEYLQDLDVISALQRYSAGLRRLTLELGIKEKYHETVTGFLLLTMAERMQAARDQGCADEDFEAFALRNADLVEDARALLSAHYSADRLDSPLARRQFLLPDRGPRSARCDG